MKYLVYLAYAAIIALFILAVWIIGELMIDDIAVMRGWV